LAAAGRITAAARNARWHTGGSSYIGFAIRSDRPNLRGIGRRKRRSTTQATQKAAGQANT
jgi:hypothetical protein